MCLDSLSPPQGWKLWGCKVPLFPQLLSIAPVTAQLSITSTSRSHRCWHTHIYMLHTKQVGEGGPVSTSWASQNLQGHRLSLPPTLLSHCPLTTQSNGQLGTRTRVDNTHTGSCTNNKWREVWAHTAFHHTPKARYFLWDAQSCSKLSNVGKSLSINFICFCAKPHSHTHTMHAHKHTHREH